MKKNIISGILMGVFAFQSIALAQTATNAQVTSDDRRTAERVTAKQLKEYLSFIASDDMEGRDTPSRGLDITARFIGLNLSRIGLKPAGDNGTFFQRIALKSFATDSEKTQLTIGTTSFKLGDEILRLSGNASIDAPLSFATHGWMVKSKGIDALRGLDVKGKIVVVAGPGPLRYSGTFMPSGVTQADLAGVQGVDWADAVTNARIKGAKGVIVIASKESKEAWLSLKSLFSSSSFYPLKLLPPEPAEAIDFPVMLVSAKVAEVIFAGEAASGEASTGFQLSKSASMNSYGTNQTVWTQNVMGLLEGSSPTLKNEIVTIGAHYDHIGISSDPNAVDKINNGADDDASGTAAVLSMAEALSMAPQKPKRSILFIWHCGEEKGFWGSDYFTKFPTLDVKQIVAYLNLDMIGRSKKSNDSKQSNKDLSEENAIYLIGSEMMSLSLGAIVKASNAAYLGLRYDYRYDDPKDKNRLYYRGDNYVYSLIGVPNVSWFTGLHEDYHKPGDEIDKIDYDKLEKVTRTILVTLLNVANLKERPNLDRKLPEMERR